MTAASGKPVNILVVGVGGQGVLLASEVLGEAAALAGLDVKKSEVHGMAQRGGSVFSHLRFGRKVHSPLISRGEADFLLSFEKLESLRYLDYLHRNSWALVNKQVVLPLPVSTGRAQYPRHVEKIFREHELRYKMIDGLGLAARAGNAKAVNSVVLGALSKLLSFDDEIWHEALRRHVPAKHLDVNYQAFALGRRLRFQGL